MICGLVGPLFYFRDLLGSVSPNQVCYCLSTILYCRRPQHVRNATWHTHRSSATVPDIKNYAQDKSLINQRRRTTPVWCHGHKVTNHQGGNSDGHNRQLWRLLCEDDFIKPLSISWSSLANTAHDEWMNHLMIKVKVKVQGHNSGLFLLILWPIVVGYWLNMVLYVCLRYLSSTENEARDVCFHSIQGYHIQSIIPRRWSLEGGVHRNHHVCLSRVNLTLAITFEQRELGLHINKCVSCDNNFLSVSKILT